MAKLDKIKKTLSTAKEKVKETVSDAGEKIKTIDVRNTAKDAIEKIKEKTNDIQESIENFDAKEAKESALEMIRKGNDSLKQHFKDLKETNIRTKQILNSKEDNSDRLCIEDALIILYFLVTSDRNITAEEEDMFALVKKEIDPNDTYSIENVMEAYNKLKCKSTEDDYLEYMIDGIQEALIHSKSEGNGVVDKRLLLWDMLAISYSDSGYSKEEESIIKTVIRKMDIDNNTVLEMESAIKTIHKLNMEQSKLKSENNSDSDYFYELEERRNVIMSSVYQLIED